MVDPGGMIKLDNLTLWPRKQEQRENMGKRSQTKQGKAKQTTNEE